MIPDNVLPFYTHIGKENTSLDTSYNLYSLSKMDRYRVLDFSLEDEVDVKYKIGSGTEEIFTTTKPYSIEYGVNKLTSTATASGTISLTNFTNPYYTEASGAYITQLTPEDPTVLKRIGDLQVNISLSFSGSKAYVGPIINDQREIIYSEDPINLNIEGFFLLHSVKNQEGTITYQPGLDYYFNPETQQLTTIDPAAYLDPDDNQQLDATTITIGQVLLIEVSYIKNPSLLVERSSGGSFSILPAPAYGLAIKGNPGANVSYNITVTWSSILDDSKSDSSYVLLLNNNNGSHTLTSSSSDNIVITRSINKSLSYKNFKRQLSVSHPVLLNSRVKLTDNVSYFTYDIDNADALAQNITVEYDYKEPENPVKLELQEYTAADNINGLYKSLPDAKGIMRYGIYNNTKRSIDNVSLLHVPASDGGLLAAYKIDQDMSFITVESAAWGLLASIAVKDLHLVVLQLKEIVRLSKIFKWDESNAGFGINFSPAYDYNKSGEIDIFHNAFLGFCICFALDYISGCTELMGNQSNNIFIEEVLNATEYLAVFIANSANQIDWKCSEKYINGYYAYDSPSDGATLYADFFLSYFICFRYNSFCHYIAAKLDYEVTIDLVTIESYSVLNSILFNNSYSPPASNSTILSKAIDLIIANGLSFDQDILNVGAIEALAHSIGVLLELRRMMPFGLRWFSDENVNNISSIIGSILYSEAELYYQYALYLYVSINKQSPTLAKFEDASRWFSYMFNTKVIGSAGRISNLISLFIDYDYQDVTSYKSLIESFFTTSTEITYNIVPDFYIYDFDSFSPNNLITYKLNPRTIDLSDPTLELTRDEFFSITFKYVNGEWVERDVPGLPIPNTSIPIGYIAVEAYIYRNSPKSNMLVIDGDMLIYPISNYLMTVNMSLEKIPFFLNTLDNFAVPAGVVIAYKNITEMVGI